MVRVLFFASARELAGVSDAEFDLSSLEGGRTTSALRRAIAVQFPLTEELVQDVTLAVNQVYVSAGDDPELKEGDEVALIPPVSGG